LKDTKIRIVREKVFEERIHLTYCITASGTATLENALLGIPMTVIYRVSWTAYWIARSMIQVPYFSMPNILSGKVVVPELIQGSATASKIFQTTEKYLGDPGLLERTREELLKLRIQLGQPGAYDRAAATILND